MRAALLVSLLGPVCWSQSRPAGPTLQGRAAAEWIADLSASHELVRAHAAWALGKLTDKPGGRSPAAVAALRAALEDADDSVEHAAAHALGCMGEAAREALPDLVQELWPTGTRAHLENNPDCPSAAALVRLGAVGHAALVTALTDLSPVVRAGAACALARCAGPADAAALVAALSDPDPMVCHWAMVAVGRAGPAAKAAVPALEAQWKASMFPEVTFIPASLLRVAPDHGRALSGVLFWARSQKLPEVINDHVLDALAAHPAGAEHLERLLLDRETEKRPFALRLLRIDPEHDEALEAALAALQSDDAALRTRAARGLAELGARFEPVLARAAAQDDAERAVAAAAALLRLDARHPLAEVVLRKALAGNDACRNQVCEGLAWAGASAAPLLRALLNGSDQVLAQRAAPLLLELDPDEPLAARLFARDLQRRVQGLPASMPSPEAIRTTVAEWAEALRGEDSKAQEQAADAVRALGRAAVPALERLIPGDDPALALAAADIVWHTTRAPGPALDHLVACLTRNDGLAREARDALARPLPLLIEAIPALLPLLEDRDTPAGSHVLWLLDNAAPELRRRSITLPPEAMRHLEAAMAIHLDAAWVLLRLRPEDPAPVAALLTLACSEDPGVRQQVRQRIAWADTPTRRRVLQQFAADLAELATPEDRARAAAVALEALSPDGWEDVAGGGLAAQPNAPAGLADTQQMFVHTLEALLDKPETAARITAATALCGWRAGDRERQVLVECLMHPDEEIRRYATDAAPLRSGVLVRDLALMLAGEPSSEAQRTFAALALGRSGDKGLSALAASALRGKSRQVRWAALEGMIPGLKALRREQAQEFRSVLETVAQDPEPWLRYQAARTALYTIGGSEPANVVIRLLREDDQALVDRAVDLLQRIGKRVEPLVIPLLEDPKTRPHAQRVLDHIRR